jgi:hypothetical protein
VVSNQFTNLSRLPFLDLNLGTANRGGPIVIDHAHNIFRSNNTNAGCDRRPYLNRLRINRWNQTLTGGSHNTTEYLVFNKPPFER